MTAEPFPVPGVKLSHLIVVADMPAARHFYAAVLGATVHHFQGVWLLLVTGGGIRCFFRDPDGKLFEISEVAS
jgi:catechol 2,3-dioxygenase-like lactoylglutathione lyase family enzyme